MSIRQIIAIIIVALAGLPIFLAQQEARSAWEARRDANIAIQINQASDLLLESASNRAQQRGLLNGALAAEAEAAPTTIEKISEQRAKAESNADGALAIIKNMQRAELEQPLAKFIQSQQAFSAMQTRATEAIKLPKSARNEDAAKAWFPAASGVIQAGFNLRLSLIQSGGISAAIADAEGAKSLLAEIAEFGGRERGLINASIVSNRPMNAADLMTFGTIRGHILSAFERLELLSEGPNLAAAMTRPTAALRQSYFTEFEQVRQKIYAAGTTGQNYPISATVWFQQATDALKSVLAAQSDASALAKSTASIQNVDARNRLVIAIAILIAALTISGGALLYVDRRIIGSLLALRNAMAQLAGGNLNLETPYRRRLDELGDMARAVELFRENGIKAKKLEEQQKLIEQRQRDHEEQAAREKEESIKLAERQRGEALLGMADTVEREAEHSVGAVSAASQQVNQVAQAMAQVATSVSQDCESVAAASAQALANAQTVSSAAEELTASIGEIGNQISHAAHATREAVASGTKAENTIRALLGAVSKISEVTKLISDVANRTNLLALNATIEAARAGDAGKGFAVVAAEVKMLATQTTKATEEIDLQISEVQAATNSAVAAVSDIGSKIRDIDQISSAIGVAVEEQSSATQEIARNVAQTAIAAQEVAHRITDVSKGATTVGRQSVDVQNAIQSVTQNIAELRSTLIRVVRESTDDASRRKSTRLEVTLKCRVSNSPSNELAAVTANISEGGAKFMSQDVGKVGQTGFIEFSGLVEKIPYILLEKQTDSARVRFNMPISAANEFRSFFQQASRAQGRS